MIQLKLLYAIVVNEDLDTLLKVRDTFLETKNVPYFEFIRGYYAKYTKFPTIDTVESKFNVALPVTNDSGDFWYAEVVEKFKERIIEEGIKKAAKDRTNAIKYIQDILIQHNVDAEAEISDYNNSVGRMTRYNEVKGTGGITYLSTGDTEIDKYTKGYKRKDLWTIGGREGIGKSWKILRMANQLDIYVRSKGYTKPILFFSNEMDNQECEDRLDSINCKISYDALISGALDSKQELKLARRLRGVESNIKFIDTAMSMAEISAYIDLYGPCAVFIDGSHLLVDDYDWKVMYTLTASMKRLTRSKKVPIVNTTHIKSGKGKSAGGGDLDDFAYAKGYTRDSDVAAMMYASPDMELDDTIGLHFLKIRRGKPVKILYKQDWEDMSSVIIEVITNMASVLVQDDGNNTGYNFT